MKTKSRIRSILKSSPLDTSITGFPTFNLSELNLPSYLEFPIPNNLRLGHLAEKIVSELIKSSANYNILYENIQLIENKRTIGEIDFIIKNKETNQLIHMELAYKFYLFDPSISLNPINNWIGPNRNDSLQEKLEKLKRKQFPLLHHHCTSSKLNDIKLDEVSQSLCLLASLFIPYQYEVEFSPSYKKAIKGYYLNMETFISLDNSDKTYYIPPKTKWGIEPSENENWVGFENIKQQIHTSIKQKQSPLCWQKYKGTYVAFFIIWW